MQAVEDVFLMIDGWLDEAGVTRAALQPDGADCGAASDHEAMKPLAWWTAWQPAKSPVCARPKH